MVVATKIIIDIKLTPVEKKISSSLVSMKIWTNNVTPRPTSSM